MCEQDLRLGRGRVFNKPIFTNDTASATPALIPNANRVAIVMTLLNGNALVPVGLSLTPTSSFPDFGFSGDNGSTIVIRIEDVGQMITQALYPSGSGVGSTCQVTEILSYANASPIP